MSRRRRLLFAAAAMLTTTPTFAAPATRPVPPPAWWSDARFGLFIHWGLYAVPAGRWDGKPVDGIGEWIMHNAKVPVADYAKLAGQFNPTRFDADAWASLARAAGMRYVVITAKHHDGFAMFRTAVDRYNVVDATPFQRDPVAELAAACRKQGLKFGVYYSQAQDWHHRGGAAIGGHWDPAAQDGDFDAYLRDVARPQVRELMDRYGPAVIWWDTPEHMTAPRALPFAGLLPPDIVSNDRLGAGVRADYATPEQRIPPNGYGGRPWETCMTINDTWGFKADDHNFKSVEQLTRDLIDIASKGGNFLLNVGPDATGVIPEPEADRLRQVGQWLAANGEAVYGTTAGPFANRPPFGRVTRRGSTLYLAVFDRPSDGLLRLPLRNHAGRAHLLAKRHAPLAVAPSDTGMTIAMPSDAMTDATATVVVLELDGPPEPFVPRVRPAADGTVTLAAADATIDGDTARLETRANQPVIGYWTDARDVVRWSLDLPPTAVPYDVELTYSGQDGPGPKVTVSVADQMVKADLPTTGTWDEFRTAALGQVRLPLGGPVALTLRRSGSALDVRSVRLVPRGG